MKITKRQLKQIIKEEMEQIQLQDLQPQVDAMVDVVGKELEQVPEDVRGIILQAVVAQLSDAAKDGLQERELTDAEYKKKKEIAAAIKRDDPEKPDSERYAIATAAAKNQQIKSEVTMMAKATAFLDTWLAKLTSRKLMVWLTATGLTL